MKRIYNLRTGTITTEELTPEEIASLPPPPTPEELAVIAAAIAKKVADQIESDLAKVDIVSQYIDNHTIAEIKTYIENQIDLSSVTNLATAVAAMTKIQTLLVKLAILHKIK